MQSLTEITWQTAEVSSPHIDSPVVVIAARNLPYVSNANRLQNLNIYLPNTSETKKLIGSSVTSLPSPTAASGVPNYYVHVHGGAWRDPQLTSTSIEAAVAHAFSSENIGSSVTAIISINYTVSPFPTHPTLPYDPIKDQYSDPAREAIHPMHIRDVLFGLNYLRTLGLADGSYVLSGHSCGACLAFQAVFQAPRYWGVNDVVGPPQPVALLGMNGLYDLVGLVYDLGRSHAHLKDVYANLIGIAFGADERMWPTASPGHVSTRELTMYLKEKKLPRLIVVDQSTEDQLVPINQAEKMVILAGSIPGVRCIRGHRCTGSHAAPWEQGYMIWQNVQDVLELLNNNA